MIVHLVLEGIINTGLPAQRRWQWAKNYNSVTTSASSQSGNPKSRRTCVCHRRVTPTRIITTFIVITCSSDFVPLVGGNDCCFLKVVTHPWNPVAPLHYSLASTFLSHFCHHYLQGSLPVIKVSVVIIVVIALQLQLQKTLLTRSISARGTNLADSDR